MKSNKNTEEAKALFEDANEESGGFEIDVENPGTYAFCFYNVESGEDKVITFSVDISTHEPKLEGKAAAKPEHIFPLQSSASNLQNTLQSLEKELEIVLLRFERHVKTQDSTESRVSVFTFIETLAILAVTAFQIYYVRRLVNRSKQWV